MSLESRDLIEIGKMLGGIEAFFEGMSGDLQYSPEGKEALLACLKDSKEFAEAEAEGYLKSNYLYAACKAKAAMYKAAIDYVKSK